MNHSAMDVDPLSTYEYPSYDSYHPINPHPLGYHTINAPSYTNNVKVEQPILYPYHNANYEPAPQINYEPPVAPPSDNPTNKIANNSITQPSKPVSKPNEETKDIKPDITNKKKVKRGKKSTYWSEKIEDATYPFYTCSVCDVNYITLQELDTHVTIHKNRMTSYRLRLKNQHKKKLMKKNKRKGKKVVKIKKEAEPDIDIKPEDGYIGNEKASDYNNENVPNENGIATQNNGTSISENNVSETSNEEKSSKQKEEEEMTNLEKIYKCYACKKQFTLSYYLKLHVRSHTDEKPYTCNVCGQSFITASKLGRHNKRIHLASRFQCRICFKVFSRFELLTAHFDKSHADDKLEGEPYDYNAILPYLKELEEQLKDADLEIKPKPEDFWWIDPNAPPPDPDAPPLDPNAPQPLTGSNYNTNELPLPIAVNKPDPTKLDIVMDDIKLDPEEELNIKKEFSDDDHHPGDDFHAGDDLDDSGGDRGDGPTITQRTEEAKVDEEKDKEMMDDGDSDEDYFPSKTWLSSPKMDLSPPSPSQHRRRKRAAGMVCDICNKTVSSASYMRIHLRTHTGEKPFKCYQCGRGFITSSKMHRHILAHHMEGDEVKTEENAEVKKESDDAGEEEVEKSKGKTRKSTRKKTKYKCLKKVKKNKKTDGEKVRKKYQKRPYACEFCHQKFLHPEMLQVHKKGHEGETLVLRCQFCLVEAADRDSLAEHEATHSGPKPYLCTICGKGYKKRETMVYHKKHHKPDREFICDVCSKRFNAACKLTKHLLTHRADKFVLRYECPVCAHMFNTKYHIQMHLATHQKEGLILEENRNEILAMVLQNARKIPKQPDAPANLTDIIPSDERSRICNICGEIFHHFYYLEEHLKSHGSRIAIEDTEKAEEKKYICPICNKGFKLHYYLKLHSFTHSKEKPFICQQCGKGFITKGKLKRHLETHTGLKKYQCHICCKFFTRPSYLRIHIRTIHGTQDYNFRFDKNNMRYDKGYNLTAVPLLTQMSSDMSQNSV